MGARDMRRFRRDPLGFLERLRRGAPGGAFRLPWGGVCVSDPELAQTVLHDNAFNTDGAGFFGTVLPARSAQLELGRAVRQVIRSRLPEFRLRLAESVAELPARTHWPTAGTALVHRSTAELMLHPDCAPRLHRALTRSATAGVLIRPPRMHQRARAELLSAKLFGAVTDQVRDRRAAAPPDEPRDVLDAVLGACSGEISDRAVADLYVLMFRSIVGTVAYSVAWSVLLGSLHRPHAPWPWLADQLVRESLRYRPVVWMVGRPVPHALEIGGVPLHPGEMASVCPYLLHHDETRWSRPEVFRPQRWSEPDGRGLYLPFSAGPFACSGAAVAHTLITETVAALAENARLHVTGGDLRPVVINAATPRPFVLQRSTDRSSGLSRKEVNSHDRCLAPDRR
ncbi:hypothetical protein NBRGN_107_00120 [Nocardia brasiliensis NBRC 14402]|uniref:cytochrome P450 n=1 Tax=Nocardia brasiliensis TaxID=37326 RepID=UPI00031A5443|nr:cytochrome P450 [Nocardia brasiliensis]ASF08965.1 cytochrome P450 [Nocardia brasiliensis]GAJ86218.1 hypothetical protein NBRGN_107_00120 [Nocardia brasiliensis NBRC 14402]SUB40434.1 Lanosterol 14-alpha demethylase [Nocardia brasiliensis]